MQTKVIFVCLGNICRSVIAQGIFENCIKSMHLEHTFEVNSAGTSSYHIGENPDVRSITVLKNHDIHISHKARKLTLEDILYYDYIIAMDNKNYESILKMAKHLKINRTKIYLLRSFQNTLDKEMDVPDPYYGTDADFENVFNICQNSVQGLIKFIILKNSTNKYNIANSIKCKI